MCKQHSHDRRSLFNHSKENMNMAVFSLDCPQVPFWSVLVFKLLPFIQNIHKLHHIKIWVSPNDKYYMFFAPAFLALVSPN